jgi:plastocyanin
MVVVLAGLILLGCGGDAHQAATGTLRVVVTADGFGPEELVVPPGAEVTFVNEDPRLAHSAKHDPQGVIEGSPQPGKTRHDGSEVNRASRAGFATHSLYPGEAQRVVFPVARRYEYHCTIYPDMRGTIVVRRDG